MIKKQSVKIYLGTFLIAFATLAFEITLTRLLSVTTWYHLAFFAVSTAMLGMTAGAVTVYVKPHWFNREKLSENIAKACLGYAVIIPVSLLILCNIPIKADMVVSNYAMLIVLTISSALPFYFSGIAITAVLTKSDLPIGKLYASDLTGASLGCLFVLGGLEILDAPSLVLLSGAIAIFAALVFSASLGQFRLRRLSWLVMTVLAGLILLTSYTPYGVHPNYVKGEWDPVEDHFIEEWNSYSRVVVYQQSYSSLFYWGASPQAPEDEKVWQYRADIDGSAATWIGKFSSTDDISYLAYDVTNIAYYLRPSGGACIIGVGGGRDVQSAILFGHEEVTGIELNPIFVNLLQNQFGDYAGIANYPGITLIVDEARSYLSRMEDEFVIIEMSLVDSWAATGAGAFSLSENALYTVEAWQMFFSHLTDDGILTVSRWFNPDNVDEIGRLASLATATLLESDISEPSQHIGVVASEKLATLLLSRQPFSELDKSTLLKTISNLEFSPIILPGEPPENERLREIVSVSSIEELNEVAALQSINVMPPTDENPYFFNMLRLNHLNELSLSETGVLSGNYIATMILIVLIICLFIVSLITIIVPLIRARSNRELKKDTILWSAAIYFSLIGAGFMFTEIALIQKLSVFLGHPTYALGVLLFTIIASAGMGSFFSERLPLTRTPWIYIYPLVVALSIVIIRLLVPVVTSNLITSYVFIKILVSIILIWPLGMLLGLCFPAGMRLIRFVKKGETPWYWALNGVFGVLCSALAVFISIYYGISTSLYIAAVCYLALPIFLHRIYKLTLTGKI